MLFTNALSFNSSSLKGIRILTVDNDNDSGTFYAALLRSYGAEVRTAGSVQEALNLLNQYIPDILICEIRFLGESVYPLIHRIRFIGHYHHKSIPIFVASTYPIPKLTDYLKVKVEAYQVKPVELDQFINQIWRLLRQQVSRTPSVRSLGRSILCRTAH